MRNSLRLLAVVKPGRYLEAGNPTGLTGLFTHAAPRSTLLYTYGAILDKLKAFPEHSVYRQSTEALTKHRMKIIESIKPEGYDEWEKRATEKMEKYPEVFQPGGHYDHQSVGGQDFVTVQEQEDEDDEGASVNPTYKPAEVALFNRVGRSEYSEAINWEPEPPLEASQYVRRLDLLVLICLAQDTDAFIHRISDAEQQIGGGLIEEVIQVAEGELKLVETMAEYQVYVSGLLAIRLKGFTFSSGSMLTSQRRWDELEEKPLPGQWDYFARDQHTPGTQEPPNK